MKIAAGTVTMVLILLVLGVGLHASPPGAVYVNYVEGSVEHIAANSVRGVPAKANRALAEGEAILVAGPGNAEGFIRDGSVLRGAGGRRLKVLSIERGAVHFLLESGKAHVNYKGLKGYPLFFSTPSAEVDVFDRSTFRVDVSGASETEVSVFAGELYVVQPKGRMKIIVGTRLVMRKDGRAPVYTTNRPADEWDKWNKARDGATELPASGGSEPRQSTMRPAPAGPDPGAAVAAFPPEAIPAPAVTHEYIYVGVGPAWGYSWYPYRYPYRPYAWRWWGPRYPVWSGYRRWHGPPRGYWGHRGHPPRRHWR
jgi:hypothetical protein